MGFRSVGKSSLAIQFVQVSAVFRPDNHHTTPLPQGQFVDSYDPTIENTFNKTLRVRNQETRTNIEKLLFNT